MNLCNKYIGLILLIIFSCSIPMAPEDLLVENRIRAFNNANKYSSSNSESPLIFYRLHDDNSEIFIMCFSHKNLHFIPINERNKTDLYYQNLDDLNIPINLIVKMDVLKENDYYGMKKDELISAYFNENKQLTFDYDSYFLFYLLTQGFYVAFVGEFGNELYIDY